MTVPATLHVDGRPAGAPWPVPDAAAYLGVSARHLWRKIAEGEIRSIRFGRRVLIPADELTRLAAEGCEPNRNAGRSEQP